jgi:SAM-dependent methyltransferase
MELARRALPDAGMELGAPQATSRLNTALAFTGPNRLRSTDGEPGPLVCVAEATVIEYANDVQLPRENIYGHYDRLLWIRDRLRRDKHAVELGCGTGYMLTLPLRHWGYNVSGVDLDEASITYGRELFREAGVPEDALLCIDFADYPHEVDTVIASEVFEHMTDQVLDSTLAVIRARLAPGGQLLVTVPNGYGEFELESALWWPARLGRVLEKTRFTTVIDLIKRRLIGDYRDTVRLSTVADSPHVQRFTLHGITARLEAAGFDVKERRGSVLICGPFSNLFFTGIRRLMSANLAAGRRYPNIASGFRLVAVPRCPST